MTIDHTAVVTGGAGFLGSHLCDRLVADGWFVVCVDNLQTGSRRNVSHLHGRSNFAFIEQDVREAPLPDLGSRVHQIYNLACPASPVAYQTDPIGTTMTNVVGVQNVLDLALKHGARVLQASTSEVYGDPAVHPQREDYFGNVNPTGPRACYDEGKRCAESLVYDYQRTRGADVRVARIFNTYGPRMALDDGRVVSNFIVQALRGDPLTIYGDGAQTRSFCYVSDLIDGLVRLMESSYTLPVNLGNPHEVNMRELAAEVLRATGMRSEITRAPLPEDDPTRRCPDTHTARVELGWSPRVSLEHGLAETVAYFRSVV